jgi:predicted metal-dependent HD superfamily phosphohydrolase
MNLQELFKKYKIKADVTMLLDMWCESHRHYHTLEHYMDLENMIENDFTNEKIDEKTYEKLGILNIFHDCVYDPSRNDNEEKSADFFISLCLDKKDKDILEIKESIIDTKMHLDNSKLSTIFNSYDMNIVERDYNSLIKWEESIYEEYKSVGNDAYKKGRLQFLEKIINNYPLNMDNLSKLMEYVKINY